jgi:large subunit ribosomal protein L9
MKVILNSDIETLGKVGDVVDVKSGYARNFLFPKKLALQMNKHNLEIIEFKKKKIQKKLELEKLSAIEQKEKLEELTLTIEKKAGENDVLFGSVTVMEIEKKLEELGVKIERKKFHLAEPIKRLGNYSCKVKLFDDVEAEIKIEVVGQDAPQEEEEPDQQ